MPSSAYYAQNYASIICQGLNPSQSRNITFLTEPGMYNLSTLLAVSDGYNFTMSSTNATVTCTSDAARFEFSRVENVHISGINFRGCKNTAIRISRVNFTNLVNCRCVNNQIYYSRSRSLIGGCLHVMSSSVIISDSEFRSNEAYSLGGAIYASLSTIVVHRSRFS